MNYIAIIILAALITELSLHLFSDYLNLKVMRNEIPGEFTDYYDSEKYKKSQDYTRINTRFGWLASSFGLAVTLTFWFGGGFHYLDIYLRAFGYGPVITGLLYIGILILLKTIISLPFSIYSTFVIEEKFGFNRTKPVTFTADMIKSLVVGIIIGAPLLSGIIYFFENTGSGAWVYCWAAATLFMIAVQYIVPTWIMPLFNKFEPVEEGELREAVFSYAGSINFSLKNIFVMDGSKRTSKSNAFFTGFGKNRRIVLFDTLIEQHTVPELLAVLAHEMGHYKKKHIIKGIITGILHMGVVFFILSLFISEPVLFEAFYMENISVYAGLLFFGMLYSPLGFFIGIFMQIISRRHEYEADRFAVETTEDPAALSDALKKLSVNNLSNLTPHPLYVFLNYSHPPILQRVRALSH